MNTRSLRFQLTVWYAGLLSGCFVLLGATAYFLLKGYLEGDLRDSQLRRARQISLLIQEELRRGSEIRLGEEIEARFAPSLNNRWVRVSRGDGTVIYLSGPPPDRSFDPSTIPASRQFGRSETSRVAELPERRQMLLASTVCQPPGGTRYLIETGAPMDTVQSDLRQWLAFLIVGLPIVVLVGVGGGYWLVKRALLPVDRIAASAQRISSQNLSERLPVARTGDEMERLSLALNHMIERLDEAFQHSRRFMADASHEMRTPLTVMHGELESLVQEPGLASPYRQRLGSTLEEVERLATIVEGLFAISRLDAGEAQAEWVGFDLAKLVASTTDQMGLLAEDKRIQLACVAADPVWVEGDRSRLKQVVVNLLDNAIKYTPPGGSVTLTVSASQDKAVFEVADNGISIPPEALPHVFERFFRVDKARSRELGGAGLGLSIVKSICAFHHGQVEVHSLVGQGSRFRVELPRVAPPADSAEQRPKA
jgi:heavy metal sensor kinase